MALWKAVKDYLEEIFFANGDEEITGETAQTGMKAFTDLIGEAEFKGLATTTTNPGSQVIQSESIRNSLYNITVKFVFKQLRAIRPNG